MFRFFVRPKKWQGKKTVELCMLFLMCAFKSYFEAALWLVTWTCISLKGFYHSNYNFAISKMYFVLRNTLYVYMLDLWKFFCDPCLIENGIVVSGDLALFVMTLEKLFGKNFAQPLENQSISVNKNSKVNWKLEKMQPIIQYLTAVLGYRTIFAIKNPSLQICFP